MNHSQVLSKKTVLQTKLFHVDEVEIETPKGHTQVHHQVIRDPSVIILPVTEKQELCMIRQYRTLYEKEIIEFPAGMIDPNEDPLGAAKRELQEETGLHAGKWKKLLTMQMAGSLIKAQTTFFLAKELTEGKAMPEETESIQVIRLSIDEVLQKITTGELITSSGIVGILLLDKLRKEGNL